MLLLLFAFVIVVNLPFEWRGKRDYLSGPNPRRAPVVAKRGWRSKATNRWGK